MRRLILTTGLAFVLAAGDCTPGPPRTPEHGATRTHGEGYTETFVNLGQTNRYWRPVDRAARTRNGTIQWYDAAAGGWFDTCGSGAGRGYCITDPEERMFIVTARRAPSVAAPAEEGDGHP